jgi:hypothetical protein
MPIRVPDNLLWFDAVQIVLLVLLFAMTVWLAKRSIQHGEKIARLELLMTNHFSHRFDQLKRMLGIAWEDEK